MNRAMEGMGGDVVKKYRIYEKALERLLKGAVSGFVTGLAPLASLQSAR